MDNHFLKAYSIKEVANKIDVAEGTIRQWEKDLNLDIPRTKDNARYFTEIEIETLTHVKAMRDKNLSKAVIKDLLEERDPSSKEVLLAPSIPELRQSEVTETLRNIQKSFESFPEVKEALLEELREEVKSSVREELNQHFEQQNKLIVDELKKITESQKALEQESEQKGFWARLFKK